VAFDLRNDCFPGQKLSFSYHDRNQTGQLMVRATDDVEKVRLSLARACSNWLVRWFFWWNVDHSDDHKRTPDPGNPAHPARPMIIFMIFGSVSQPLFAKLQYRISALNTVPRKTGRDQVGQSLHREKSEQAKFERSASSVMDQQIKITRLFAFLFRWSS